MLGKQTFRFKKYFANTTTIAFVLFVMDADISRNISSAQSHIHYINWNTTNPRFKDYGNNVIDITAGTEEQPWRYEQANIICPRYSSSVPSARAERYIIYNVTKSEFEHCHVINPQQNKVVAVCNTPYKLTFFTLTFRAFSPVPGAFEFHPGENYYFISTSSKRNLNKHSGGRCATHNMRLVFRIRDINRGDNSNYSSNIQQKLHENTFLSPSISSAADQQNDYNEYDVEDNAYYSNDYERPEAVQSNAASNNLVLNCDSFISLAMLFFSELVIIAISSYPLHKW